MKGITLDLNIILDFLFKRDGHAEVVKIFERCAIGGVRGYVCAHEITTLSYFLDKAAGDNEKNALIISEILDRFEIIEINQNILTEALRSAITDYEDAVIETASKSKGIKYIITRNIKDFKKSSVKAITPQEYLLMV
jgi:predicted nucleic acid-binding protein